MRPGDRLEHILGRAGFALLAALAAACLLVASRQWFFGDDFSFLAHARESSLWRDWWPFGERHWIFYRPLGMHSYYALGLALFGIQPLGFLALSLLAATTAALAAAGIARRLGLSPPARATTALAVLAALVGTDVLRSPTTFHYVAALLATTVALGWLIDGAPGRSLLALLAGLLCNEIAAITPVAAAALIGAREGARPALRRSAPLALAVTLYLVLRFSLLASDLPDTYGFALGGHVAGNALAQIRALFGGDFRGLAVLAVVAPALLRRTGAPDARLLVAFAAWAVAALLPFSLMLLPRAPVAAALPVALALGVAVERCLALGRGRPTWRRCAPLAALALALLPAEVLWRQAIQPVGALPQRLYETLLAHGAPRHPTRLLLLHSAPGLGGEHAAQRLRWQLHGHGGNFSRALFPERDGVRAGELRVIDVSRFRRLPRPHARCLYLGLDDAGEPQVPDPALVASLPRPLRTRCEPVPDWEPPRLVDTARQGRTGARPASSARSRLKS